MADFLELYQRVKGSISPVELGWVIQDSISRSKLTSLLSKVGIIYPGVRLASIPTEELAADLAEEFFHKVEVATIVTKVLNEANAAEIEKVTSMDVREVMDYVNDEEIFFDKRVGNVIWALLADHRTSVNQQVINLKKSVDKINRKIERAAKRAESTTKRILANDAEIEKILTQSHKKMEEDARLVQRLERQNEKIVGQNRSLKETTKQLRGSLNEALRERGLLRKQNSRLQEELSKLSEDIKNLEDRGGRRAKLSSQLYRLEKENKKLRYQLEKVTQSMGAKVTDLEKENAQLRQDLGGLEKKSYRLEEELGAEKELCKKLELEKSSLIGQKDAKKKSPPEKERRIGVFVDGQNMYYAARTTYEKRVDYKKLLPWLVGQRHLVKAIYYIVETPEWSSTGFITMLKFSGYDVRSRALIRRADGSAKGDWDMGMATDIIRMVDKNSLDIVTIVSGDGDFVDLIKVLKPKGVRVEVAGFPHNTAMDLTKVADEFFPIDESLMV